MNDQTGDPADVLPMVHPFGLRVRGEIDHHGRPALARALAWALRIGETDIHLDLSELTFIDAGGLRLIISTATDLPPPRRLVLQNASSTVRELMELLGWRLGPEDQLYRMINASHPHGPDPAPSPPS
ncbi:MULTISPECIES: STAS domain-containing protein [unclassified Nonomuraea]|uniref:STAS domain-containing protein n=1 Tax=unclassified Nonomuraea TaxID=2593643 RepID=UPI0033D9BE86